MERAAKINEKFADIVQNELDLARQAYPPMNSLHEAYAVILEEVKEFEMEVFRKPDQRHVENILKELAQIAAMCQRTAEDCLLIKES
jgi:translation initiation factor 2B subunit (eIF-2B alpha/beta/delta family)